MEDSPDLLVTVINAVIVLAPIVLIAALWIYMIRQYRRKGGYLEFCNQYLEIAKEHNEILRETNMLLKQLAEKRSNANAD